MPSKKTTTTATNPEFPIVGIGASAGGLDAFRRVVRNIPQDTGMAYVLVQHLAPDHESLLPEFIAKETSLPVHEITDEIHMAPDSIYIIPENKILTVIDGKLKLEPRENKKAPNMAIDIFLTSLAEVHKSFARGVVLSGSGFDGTAGLQAVKEFGGSTFVQRPETAAFDSMPLSAIRRGAADFVLAPEEIPGKLQQIDAAYGHNRAYTDNDQSGKSDDEFFRHVIKLLRLRTGNDFSHYKQPTIRRRIARRMVITKKEDPETYINFLKTDKKEQDALFDDILIPVSYFFRDSKTFEMLCESAFPHILSRKDPEDSIRVWIAGCSTGEEAYSMAICLHEFLADKAPGVKVQLFASDISDNVIAKARAGLYTWYDVQNVPEQRLKNYFTKSNGVYHINKEIRDMCVFAVHNFVKDPPFAKMDMISCRNVLIYLDPFLQKKALNTFHYALKGHGVLFLGKSESVGYSNNLFDPMVKGQKIFARKDTKDNRVPISYERQDSPSVSATFTTQKKKNSTEPDFLKKANEVLFSKYTPPGVIINENKEIVHFHGDTSPFLLPAPGKPNFNIYKMLREGLTFELRNALLKAKTGNATVKKENITLKDKDYIVTLEVIPLDNDYETHYMVLFHRVIAAEGLSRGAQKKSDAERIKMLEAELEQMREDIRRVTEDQEAANEELQSANEELLSNSEELQTLNMELETAAEELQSNNEELITVNNELMDRQEQLTVARLYSDSVIETIREPLIVLDRELRIKRANAGFYNYFQASSDEADGKVIFEVSPKHWNIEGLRTVLSTVVHDRKKVEGMEVRVTLPESGERTMLLNISPITNEDLEENLILLAIEDITDITRANIMLKQNNSELEENNKELASFSYMASHDLQEPLRKIHTFSKLISDDGNSALSEDSKLYLERIMVSSRRMQRLTEDLLRYSHITADDTVEMVDTDLDVIVKDVLDDMAATIEKSGAVIDIFGLPVTKAVPLLMRQLFSNLIGNAIKYAGSERQPIIRINCSRVSAGQTGKDSHTEFYRITVSDNGIGFLPEHAGRIFEPFQRLHSKDKYEGTGIGLAICKKIAIYHKGDIIAESMASGAAFHIYLPA
ncbi:MAG: CheR family methyltransferase [Bacteroidia bacterium]